MKRIAYLLVVLFAVSFVTMAAQKKEGHPSAAAEQHVVINPADLKWMDAPPGLPAGAKMAVLSGDPGKKGLFTVRLQAPAGYKSDAAHASDRGTHHGHFRHVQRRAGEKFDEAVERNCLPAVTS